MVSQTQITYLKWVSVEKKISKMRDVSFLSTVVNNSFQYEVTNSRDDRDPW